MLMLTGITFHVWSSFMAIQCHVCLPVIVHAYHVRLIASMHACPVCFKHHISWWII